VNPLPTFALTALLVWSPTGGPMDVEAPSLTEATLEIAQTGTVTGQILDRANLRPVPAVQVLIADLGIGALTEASGRFTLSDVPVGTYELSVERIGYRTEVRQVEVRADEVTSVNIEIAQQALALDELLVTGTVGGTQRRAIGNVVDRIDAASLTESAPALNVEQLMSTRATGLVVQPSPGMVGTGTGIQIRGLGSMVLGAHPLIYVDGIRVDNNPSAGPPLRQGRQVSRFNDWNLQDIESIEVIKGPAAATLYGTEASAGVIQIITKRGAEGATTVDVSIQQGATWMMDPEGRVFKQHYYDPVTGVTDSINLYRYHRERTGENVFTYGHLQSYSASISGGSPTLRHYASLTYDDQTGIVDYNTNERFSGRVNLSLVPSETWDLDANLGFVRTNTRFAQAAPGFGVWDFLIWGRPTPSQLESTGGFAYAPLEVASQIEARSLFARTTGNFRLTHNPFGWLTHRLNVGIDYGNDQSTRLFPRVPPGETNWFGARGTGEKIAENTVSIYRTVDWSASASLPLTDDISSVTSVGVQYFHRSTEETTAEGTDFPTPSVTTVGGAATRLGGESFIENKSLGVFVQEQIGWRDRLFVTAAVRADDNSAFGADFDAAIYPKFSGTWVISEEDFFDIHRISQLRLRAAWGKAGRQPDVFDAVTLYQPKAGPGGQPAISPMQFGNPELAPEVGSELELGFDLGLLEDRVDVQFTWYNGWVNDAIANARVRPSLGFPGFQVVNLGEIKKWGTELSVNARVLDEARFGWDLGVNFATHKDRVEDLGDEREIAVGATQHHRVGYPIGALHTHRVVSAEFVPGSTSLQNVMCDGGAGASGWDQGGPPVPCDEAPLVFFGTPTPTWSGNVNTSVRVGRALRFGAMAEFRGGHIGESGDINAGHTSFSNTRAVNPVTDPILQAYRTVVQRAPSGIYDAGFARLREISVSYTLPEEWVSGYGFSRASINAAARNLWFLWRAQDEVWGSKIFDPETRTPGDTFAIRHQTTIPPASQFVTTIRLSF
jgi:TonB-linked SusC/RagA family outer membrane protein